MKMSGSSGKECEESAQKAEVSHDDLMEGATKESLSDKRETETPDTATKPDGKAQKTFNAQTPCKWSTLSSHDSRERSECIRMNGANE